MSRNLSACVTTSKAVCSGSGQLQGYVATPKAVLRFLHSAPYVVISSFPCYNTTTSIELLTNLESVYRGFGNNSVCGVCGHNSKDVVHAIRDCTLARNIWNLLIPTDRHDRFYSDNLQDWLISNLQNYHDFCFGEIIGSCSVFEVELWGILDGLGILIDQGYSVVAIQTNNLKAAKAIQKRPIRGSNSALIRRIHYLLAQLNHWSISYISRMDNQEADTLVKLAHEARYSLQVFETSPLGGLG
ncbi:hypothetical protein Godav_029951 [Gossypium davidsonii]|uniref:RNase H type-1 domain-containing protein n=1 Tax=Gossypium davidsonii TaxID=34287 RepID=A0A7J8T7U4_GOSDV|nr:hypothetical protein [Gossypium davidsonii]